MFCTFWLGNVLRATTAFFSQLLKVVRSWGGTFWLGNVFAPQRCALFDIANFQKCSEAEVLCAFWLGNVLRATTACTFSTSQLLKVFRSWGAFYILTWKCASRHNGVQFFISHLASWLRTCRFGEPIFRPPEPQIIGETTFSRTWIFFFSLFLFLLLFSSLTLPCSAFDLSILSEVWLLNFLRWYFYGISMIFLCDFSGISKIFHLDFYDISRGFLWDSHEVSLEFLWWFCDISIEFLWGFHGISMIFLWVYYGVPMGFNTMSMGFPLGSYQ